MWLRDRVHNLGELWALMLWQARGILMNHYKDSGAPGGWKAGNQHMLQLVTDALKLTPSNPTYPSCNSELGAQVHNLGELWALMLWQARGILMNPFIDM